MRTLTELNVATAIEKLFDRAQNEAPMRNYFGLLTLLAGAKAAVADGDEWLLAECKKHLDAYPTPHSSYNFELYEAGGSATAYLLFEGKYERAREFVRTYAEKTLSALRSDDGIICYRKPEQGKWIWVDAIAAVAPFMLYAGLALDEQRYVDFAADQTVRMFDALLDPACGLLHQVRGRYPDDPARCSEDHWSRGNGWMMVALAELIEHLPKTSVYYEAVAGRYRSFCANLLRYQSLRGLWRQEITVEGAWEESSGTGLIAYGIGTGIRVGLLNGEEYRKSFALALWGLANHCITENYHTYHSCESNCFPGIGEERGSIRSYICIPKTYRDEPHSFGSILLALVEARKNGITSVQKYAQTSHCRNQ